MNVLKKLARLLTRQSPERPSDHFKHLRPDMAVAEYVRQFERNANLTPTDPTHDQATAPH